MPAVEFFAIAYFRWCTQQILLFLIMYLKYVYWTIVQGTFYFINICGYAYHISSTYFYFQSVVGFIFSYLFHFVSFFPFNDYNNNIIYYTRTQALISPSVSFAVQNIIITRIHQFQTLPLFPLTQAHTLISLLTILLQPLCIIRRYSFIILFSFICSICLQSFMRYHIFIIIYIRVKLFLFL